MYIYICCLCSIKKKGNKYNDDYNTIKKKYDSADVNKISDDDVAKNWQGLCKNTYGKDWWRQQTTNIFN